MNEKKLKLNQSVNIALILNDYGEIEFFTSCLIANGLNNITSFTSASEALNVALKKQFSLFVTRVDMQDMNGLIMIQKMRESGNYGLESHLIVNEKIDPASLNILFEYNLSYVAILPSAKEIISEKIKYLVENENNLSPEEQLYREAQFAYNSSMFDMAESTLEMIPQEKFNFEKLFILKGDLELKKECYDIAEKHYDNAIKINPQSSVAASKLASCYLLQGHFQKSSEIFNSLYEINKFNIKALENAGLSNIKCDDFINANRHLEQLVTVDKENKIASVLKVDIKIKHGDFEGLPKILSKTHSEAEIVKILNNKGIKLAKEKDPASAIKMYNQCLNDVQSDKYHYAIYYNIGLAHMMQKNLDYAKQFFEKALSLKTDFEKAKAALEELSQK